MAGKTPLLTGVLEPIGHGLGQRIYPMVKPDAPVSVITTDTTLTVDQLDQNITNTGAGDTVVLSLPPAAVSGGYALKVYISFANPVQLVPHGKDQIFLAGSGNYGDYLNIAGSIGNYADVLCDGNSWLVTSYSGSVTKAA